jgi:bifunctional non-homologous end joining protein LigD
MALAGFPQAPMKAVASPTLPTEDGGWAYEIKWDGMRILAFVGGAAGTGPDVVLQSANLRDVTVTFPELAALSRATRGRPAVLDGEVIALDDAGRPSFGRLQQRMHVTSPREAANRAAEVPAAYQIFDLLAFDGLDATPLPYAERRRLLADVVVPGPAWSVPGHHVGDGQALLASVDDLGMEGVLAKRLDSPYEPARRSRAWLKVKVRRHQELVVGGWAEGEGRRAGTLGALLVGYHDPSAAAGGDPTGPLRYAGRVGTGFTDHELGRLAGLLGPLALDRCPFEPEPPALHRRGARWVTPTLVVEVAYGEWTDDSVLRHPAYLGQRTDKEPGEVTRAP